MGTLPEKRSFFPKAYESPAVRAVTGPAIRPGGLELTRHLAAACGLRPGDRVLDVGCGAGATAGFLAERCGVRAVGLDLSPVLLADAIRSHPTLPVIRGSAMRLPLAAGSLDAVLCECVLSLLPDPMAGLTECFRVLKPGGFLGVSDLYLRRREGEAVSAVKAAGGCLGGALDRWALAGQVQSAGFELRRWEDHSERLKVLAARLVWAGISLEEWWGYGCAAGGGNAPGRPGYFLMIARRRA